jgi:hypothetical protein
MWRQSIVANTTAPRTQWVQIDFKPEVRNSVNSFLGHLSGCHNQFEMLDATLAARVPIDFYVVRHIRERGGGRFFVHPEGIGRFIARISAVKPVFTKEPEIARDGAFRCLS